MFYFYLVFVFLSLFLVSVPSLDASSAASSSSSSSSSFIRHQFASRAVSRIEAVESYSIVIGKNHHQRTASNDNNNNNDDDDDQNWSHHWRNHHSMAMIDEKNYLPLVDHTNTHFNVKSNNNNNNNNNNKRFRAEGATWIQPYPSSISLSFRVFGSDYYFPHIKLDRDLFSSDIGLNLNEENMYKHMRATYSAGQEEIGSINDIYPSWLVVTLELDGRFSARLSQNGTIMQIDHTNIHIDDLSPGNDGIDINRIKDTNYNPHSLVAFYSHHRSYFPPLLQIKGGETINNNNNNNQDSAAILSDGPFVPSHGRRLLMSKWTNCFPNDSIKRRFFIGIAMDVGYYRKVGGTPAAASNSISTVIASVNKVYETQLNIYLQVADTSIRSDVDGDAWNNLGADQKGSCDDMGAVLNQFTAWRRDVKGSNLGLWHLFGNCNYGGGIAWQSVSCLNTGAALSNWYPMFWETVAHELGHNFGANHPFDQNTTTIGKWGGIMDYYDHKIKGSNDQFANLNEVAYASTTNTNKNTNKDEMCQHITESLTGKNIEWAGSRRLPVNKCWAEFDAPFTTVAPGPAATTTPPPSFPSGEFIIQWSPYPDRIINGAAQLSQYTNGQSVSSDQKFVWKSSTNQIQLSGTNKCLDISDEKIDVDLTRVLMWDCDTSGTKLNQKFIRRGSKLIQVQASTKCIDVSDGKTAVGSPLIIYECNDQQPNQQFNLITINNPTTTSQPTAASTTATTKSPVTTTTTTTPKTTITTTTSRTSTTTTTKVPPSQFGIYWQSHQDRVVDIDEALNADGTTIKFWVPNGANGAPGSAQLFEWVNGEQLRWVNTNKCLDVWSGANKDGNVVKIYTCSSTNTNQNQKWLRIGTQIQWKGRNKCLNVANGQYDPAGALLQIWTCDSAAVNQQFVFSRTEIKTTNDDFDVLPILRRDDFVAADGSITNPAGNGNNNDNNNDNDNTRLSSSASTFSIPVIAAIAGGCGALFLALIIGVMIYRHKKHQNTVMRSTKDNAVTMTAV